MQITIDNFETFIDIHQEDDSEYKGIKTNWLQPKNMDISGGRLTIEEVDKIADFENHKDIITISGLTQETFEYFISKYGKQFRVIRFFKNKMVEDWSLLSTLPNLEYIYWFHNQRITKLWDMSNNTNLKAICLSDFSRLRKLDGIEKAPNLELFSLKDAVWDKNDIETYTCFKNTNIKFLHFGARKILDEDLSFVKEMPYLECFECSPYLFPTEKIAWVMANCPNIKGRAFNMFIDTFAYDKQSGSYDVPALCLTGKGKRKFVAANEAKKNKLAEEFMDMMDRYRGKEYYEVF